MIPLAGTRALVAGRDPSGEAAFALLRQRGAMVEWADADEPCRSAEKQKGPTFGLIVVSAGCQRAPAWVAEWGNRGVPILAERELAFQESLCLHVAVAGASGKSTTTELIAHLLRAAGRRVEIACGLNRPACRYVEASRDLDLLVHGVEASEMAYFDYFRPVVAVLLNAPADMGAAGVAREGALRGLGRLFARQQAFDWAIVQSEALAALQAAGVVPPGKVISFSATSRQADLALERGVLVSRLEGWTGRLWDMAQGKLRGPHFAEDILAALAVGRVLRLALDEMRHALESFHAGRGRMEALGEVGGVRFVDDGRSANLDALAKALITLAPLAPEHPFIWLIAGGALAGRQFYDLGPLLSPRVKQALVYGEAGAAMRAAWSLFTPCSPAGSLVEAAHRAVEGAVNGDTVLFSPACPRSASLSEGGGEVEGFRQVIAGLHERAASRLGTPSGEGSAPRAASKPPSGPHRRASDAGVP
jgi:UDP-N-acetylmuramoylalanine--D-glutamate ligase